MLAHQASSHAHPAHLIQLPVGSERALSKHVMNSRARVFERHEHIFGAGDPVKDIFKVEAGHVCIYRTLVDGRRHIIAFAQPGDYIGLGTTGNHTNHARATERTRLRCLPISEMRGIVRSDPDFGLALYEAISRELEAAEEHLTSVCHRTALERLAGFLWKLTKKNATSDERSTSIVLHMTRVDIADYLGLTIETVSRTLSKLRAKRIIDLEQSVLITILDARRLKAIAQAECG